MKKLVLGAAISLALATSAFAGSSHHRNGNVSPTNSNTVFVAPMMLNNTNVNVKAYGGNSTYAPYTYSPSYNYSYPYRTGGKG